MVTLLKNLTVFQPNSIYHLQVVDILISDKGIIEQVSSEINVGDADTHLFENTFVSTLWVDAMANWGEPGLEHNETLITGSAAAAAGGFGYVGLLPNTHPVIDNVATLFSLTGRQRSLPVTILPIAAVTLNCADGNFSEMYDLANNGAVAFSNGRKPLQNSGLTMKALQYLKAIDKPLIQVPQNMYLHPEGLINEGVISTQLGLPGQSIFAETILIERDIALAQYTQSKLHLAGISCAKSVELIKQAKDKGVKVTCSASPMHLNFTDEDLINYNTNLKLFPPLRSLTDKRVLIESVNNGDIDFVFSHHTPVHNDDKDCEFETAKPGVIAHQTAFAECLQAGITIEAWIKMQSDVSKFFYIDNKIEVGAEANFSFFALNKSFTYSKANNKSKSMNTAFLNTSFDNAVLGIFHKNKLTLNES